MADSTLNRFQATGTTAERTAFVPSPPTPASGPDQGYTWFDTDDSTLYAYDFGAAAWVAGGGGSGTVTNTGTLTSNALILGNGGVDVAPMASLGTTTTVLHGNAAGAPTFGAVSLTADVSGTLPVGNGGTGQTSYTDGQLLIGNSSGNTLTKATLTAGSGISVMNGGGSITIAASGSSGKVVQVVNTQTGAVATGTTVIPFDNSIPQNTEGDEYMTLAITPTSATNKLKIDVVFFGTSSQTNWITVALFQDSTANALAAFANFQVTVTAGNNSVFSHYMTAGTTSSTTFKVRAGRDASAAGTVTFNGQSGGRIFGGVMASSITITEIVP